MLGKTLASIVVYTRLGRYRELAGAESVADGS